MTHIQYSGPGSAGAGDTGPTGPTGATGPTGPQGSTGANSTVAGPTGATGPAGTSVNILGSYASLALLQAAHPTGNAGDGYMVGSSLYVWSTSSSSWVNVGNIQGPTGPAGAQGPTGPTGANGATGPAGANGTNGSVGPTGPAGAAGAAGAAGPTGPAGANGSAGAVGATGPAGATGPTGPQGVAGVGSTSTGYYGSFIDTTATQTAAAINTGYAVAVGTNLENNQVTLSNTSRINFAKAGTYNLQLSLQLTNSDTGTAHNATVWLKKNGTDVSQTSGVVAVPSKHGSSNGQYIAAWNYVLTLAANDYLELWWSVDNTQVYIETITPPAGPSAPGVIVTAQQVAVIGGNYGYFTDTTTQTNAGATSANLVKFGNSVYTNGVTASANVITISTAGYYSLTFTGTMFKSTGATGVTASSMWYSINGTNATNGIAQNSIYHNDYNVVSWTVIQQFSAGDLLRLYWWAADTSTQWYTTAAGTNPTRPAIPSVEFTVRQIG